MKVNSKEKGFTIVELVIVVAVIGILAAILIPTFVNLTSKAKEQSDRVFIKNLNTQLSMNEVEQGRNRTMTEAVEDSRLFGFDVSKLTPVGSDHIYWDSTVDRFGLMTEDGKIAYDGGVGLSLQGREDHELWRIYSSMPSTQKYSIYAKKGFNLSGTTVLTVGFDAGDNKEDVFETITANYSDSKTYIICTNNQNIELTAPNAEVLHYGKGAVLTATKLKDSSYHEYGSIRNSILNEGHIKVEDGGFLGNIHFASQTGAAKLSLKNGSITGSIFVDDTGTHLAQIRSEGNASIVYLSVASGKTTDLDIELSNPPTYSNTFDQEVGSLVIKNVGDAGEVKPLPTGDHPHQWVPEGGNPQICAICGEIKYTAMNEEGKEEEYVQYDTEEPEPYSENNTTYGFFNSYQEGNDNHWVHQIATVQQFRNIGIASFKYPGVTGTNAVFEILSDLDFGGVSPWWDSENECWYNLNTVESPKTIRDFTFSATLDGKEHTLSNISAINQTFGARVNDVDIAGLFDETIYSTFKNFTLSNITISNSSAKPGAIIACGYNGDSAADELAKDKFIKFNNVTIDSTCSLTGNQGCGGFLGYARGIKTLEFIECSNAAKITCTGSNVGGFMGTLVYGNSDRRITFNECRNSGQITALNIVGGFFGTTPTNGKVSFVNCSNTGDVYGTSTSSSDAGLFCGQYMSDASKYTFTTVTNSGYLYHSMSESIKNHGFEFTNTVFAAPEVAKNYVLNNSIVEVDVSVNSTTKIVEASIEGQHEYHHATLKINFGPVDTFRLVDSIMIGSGGTTATSETVNNVSSFTLKELNRVGWFAPASNIQTGAFDGASPSDPSAEWYNYYKLPFDRKGTSGYEQGYHMDENGGYYISANENCVDQFEQIGNRHNEVSYEVTLFDSDNNIVGFGKYRITIYPSVDVRPNPVYLPYEG